MEYLKLKDDGSFDYQITTHGNIEWDADHFCPASSLSLEEAELFGVVPLIEVPMPEFNSNTHKCFRDGAEIINNKWHYKWAVVELSAEELSVELTKAQKAALIKINDDDNRIYADVIGNKATEYTAAEIAAQEYKDAGYIGAVPELVQAWADAKLTWTTIQATEDILVQAAAWRQAASLIRRYRLKAKEDVKRATTIEEVNSAMIDWNGFVISIRTQLGVSL